MVSYLTVYIDAEVKGLCGIILDCVYRCCGEGPVWYHT